MKSKRAYLFFLLFLTTLASGRETLSDLLEQTKPNMADENQRLQLANRLKVNSTKEKDEAVKFLAVRGMPARRVLPNGTVYEVVRIENDEPIFFKTHNANASISSGANLLNSVRSLTGTGLTVGIWDAGAARNTHQEFGGRVTIMDGAAFDDHATHVCGTIAASGVVASAKGMAPNVSVHSYDWSNDDSEMSLRGANAQNQAGKIYISSHSYGYLSGWDYEGTNTWRWYGVGTSATGVETEFGMYNTNTRDHDSLAFSLPYYLIFRSAGNDRSDNPVAGDSVFLSSSSSTLITYSPTSHPGGDGSYHNGYECMDSEAVSKNVVTVGAVNDAVTSGVRDVAKATQTSFSSWGPTDDGRIKPDIVANGATLYSSVSTANTDYASYSGTSMSTPSAAGTATLLTQLYGNLFPSQNMRASTLKGLLIHTASDTGTAGPDYQNGWGLINGVAAGDLISDHSTFPAKKRLNEGLLTTTITTGTYEFTWDGASVIRATLCWTDPAGTSTTTSDLRTAKLVNNLDLKIIAPNGVIYQPYTMPFVGTWTIASMSAAATTGKNNTDNVEQVYIPAPPQGGLYKAIVTYDGTLTNSQQYYSLLISGSSNQAPSPLTITTVSPNVSAQVASVAIDIAGTNFGSATAIKLTRAGYADIPASTVVFNGGILQTIFNLSTAAPGLWNVVATNTNGESFTLPQSFTVQASIFSNNFDGAIAGWASSSQRGANGWALSTTKSHSPTKSYWIYGVSTKTTTHLTSPTMAIPANANNIVLSFWHDHNLQAARDGARIQLSVDNGGTWFNVEDSTSGASFTSNGYQTTMGRASASNQSDFYQLLAWSGNSSGFINTKVALTNTAKYAGKNFRVRFTLATDASVTSPGWYVDDVQLIANIPSNDAPIITTSADTASTEAVADADGILREIIRSTATTISVVATDDAGESNLSYSWAASSPVGGGVTFSTNNNNAAKNATATFSALGDYTLTATATDAGGFTASSSVRVRVIQNTTSIVVTPASTTIAVGSTTTFQAVAKDQFGNDYSPQPSLFSWTTSGGGSINSSGSFTAQSAGTFTITAADAAISGTSTITITDPYLTWRDTQFTSTQITEGLGDPSADPDGDGLTNLMEYQLGLNPNDFASCLKLSIQKSGSDYILTINRVVTTGTFRVETSTDLTTWTTLVDLTITENVDQYPVPVTPLGSRRFYRVVYTLP